MEQAHGYGRRIGAALSALLLAGATAACGSDGESGTDTSGGAGGATSAAVETAMKTTGEFSVPDAKIDTSSLKGKTIYYVPLSQQVPAFSVTAQNLSEAAALVGMKVQVCNGGANPSQISACVDQAVGARAGAIIGDSFPYGMAQNSLDKAVAANVPVLITDQIRPEGTGDTTKVAYLPGAVTQQEVLAEWIAADSGGKAQVVISMLQDSPSAISYVKDYAMPKYEEVCAGCKVTINEVSAANFQRITPTTSAALLQNPNATYLQVEFEDFLQPSLDAVQQAGRSSAMKVAVSGATISGLGVLKGDGPVKAALALDFPYQGWASLDQAMRMMLGEKPQEYRTPVRLFTSANIDGIRLTAEAQSSGEWFGTPSYEEEFKALWAGN
ncbi:monosaccharide ABC transporter substrate-binding protein (CUT2 family) [Actinocorallia herbida]|uniref:Monosaccharide ABC transporter substrate-binding protein (CUT2 family) n=1 Tax=Actinocorallia herbida TaxID=58109 RepID=A0A3N1D0Y6_9ACTN|nr:substrate-binding domain-containing protein [Actinocorallia herbida]ROO87193.1 monosaccharide ABC transporter substrate-binding protein (CUT2 family) [Actinocorallia herbida]